MTDDAVYAIKQALDIVDYIGRYVHLTQRGQNYFGLCPFHNEKTPSFSVNSGMQIYKCFGCNEAGDIFTFVQKYHNVDFPEALQMLADEANINLDKVRPNSKEYESKKQLYEINRRVADFYHKVLKSNIGKQAREYLQNRKLSKEAWEKFLIGYAPKSSNFLMSRLRKHYTTEFIKQTGLLKPEKMADKYYDRIMFPIFDTRGRVVAFSGRTLQKDDKRPKYLNSPETSVFQKRYTLFGLYQATRAIHAKGFVIMVEGQTDVISSHMCGAENVVSTLGTSLTYTHLDVLRKLTDTVAIAFDMDSAGQTAVIRATNMAFEKGFDVKAIPIPYGKDADECIQHNSKIWIKATENPVPVIEYIISNSLKNQTPHEKKLALNTVLPMIHKISDMVIKDHYMELVSQKLAIPVEHLRDMLEKGNFNTQLGASRTLKTEEKLKTPNKQWNRDEVYYLALIIQNKDLRTKELLINSKFISDDDCKILYLAMLKKWQKHTVDTKFLSSELVKMIKSYIMPSDDMAVLKKDMNRLIMRIKKHFYEEKIRQIAEKGTNADTSLISKYIAALSDLQKNTS